MRWHSTNLIAFHYLESFLPSTNMEPESSMRYSADISISPYSERHEFNSPHHIVPLEFF
jgi:hypothetical protein